MSMHSEPLFLLRIAESHQENIWTSRLNPAEDLIVIHLVQRFELRRVPAGYAHARIVTFYPGRCARGTRILAPRRKMR